MLNELKPGDVGFVMHHDNKISKLIAWFMRSRWSHTFLVYKNGLGEVFIIETSDYAVGIYTLAEYLSDPFVEMVVLSHNEMTDEERAVVVEGAKKTLKQGYGYFQLLSFAAKILLSRIGIKISHFIRWGLVCNHVVMYGYTLSERPALKGMDPESIHTEEMYQLLLLDGFQPVLQKGIS